MASVVNRKRKFAKTFATIVVFCNQHAQRLASASKYYDQLQKKEGHIQQRQRNTSVQCAQPFSPNKEYNTGDIVSNNGKHYMCKQSPYDQWCNNIEYMPGVGQYGYWAMAWQLIEECQDDDQLSEPLELVAQSSSINISGESSSSSKVTVKKPSASTNNDEDNKGGTMIQLSNLRPTSPEDLSMAESFSQQSSLYKTTATSSNEEGGIDGVVAKTADVSSDCAPPFTTKSYEAGELSSHEGKNYECRASPINAWCGNVSYGPGTEYSYIAWIELGDCILTTTEEAEEAASNMDCGPTYEDGATYSMYSIASVQGINYQCEMPGWCGIGYQFEPTVGYNWNSAWTSLGACGTAEGAETADVDSISPIQEDDEVPLVQQEEEEEEEEELCPLEWDQGTTYAYDDIVGTAEGQKFKCKVEGWCNVAAYEPLSQYGLDAWVFVGYCKGRTAAPTTSSPTKAPNPSPKLDINDDSQATDYSNSHLTAQTVFDILHSKSAPIDNELFLYQGKAPSDVYRYSGFISGLQVMVENGVAGKHFYLGNDNPENGYWYGLVNIAAFLGQSMKETIQYDACDENSWDYYNGKYPLSNACGQLGQSYQDYHCSDAEKHMECPVDPSMSIKGTTHAKWYGAPGPLFCGSKTEYPFTGKWDYGYGCNNPWANPPEYCTEYEGQKAGRSDNSGPVPNRNGRTDVEGCCWWGRGVIQTTGVCNFGKLNYFLGKRAADEGRVSRYPDIDFCKNPGIICSSDEHKELKWLAGMFYWIESLQSYTVDGWSYMEKLHQFVDGGMVDQTFIDSVSGIVNRGCHDAPCETGPVDGEHERATNFKKVIYTLTGKVI